MSDIQNTRKTSSRSVASRAISRRGNREPVHRLHDVRSSRPRTSTTPARARARPDSIAATIRPQGDSIPQGSLQRWTLHLETAGGAPVDSALVAVDGGMPQHGHGLPTKPRVTRALGNGDHLVEGMKFNMGGWWVVKFRVNATPGSDSLVFNVKL